MSQIAINHERLEQTVLTEDRVNALLAGANELHDRFGHDAVAIAWAMLTPAWELGTELTLTGPSPFIIIEGDPHV